MAAVSTNPRVLTLTEVAAYLRVNRMTAYRYCRTGRLPHFRIGSEYRFLADELERWIVNHTNGLHNGDE